ncbi:MAG: alpha/beta hydrolase-fold protein, partial [Candidatus Marinimicrobia bacterium]|nr:alpha/beta hydrolase-fold protein [Candidatus Neomarinimicrobiota bacterium]
PFEYHGQEINAEAQLYGRFLVETLKPYVDKHYRTKKGRKFTAVSGSSMGGLVSVYLALEYQDIFSKVGALSSAFGVCRDDLIGFIAQHPKKYSIRFWLDAGTEEGENMEIEINQIPIRNALIVAGWKEGREVNFKIYEGAEHNESYWRQRFGDVVMYLWDK